MKMYPKTQNAGSKRFNLLFCLLALYALSLSPAIAQSPTVRMTNSDARGMSFNLTVPILELKNVSTPSGTFQRFAASAEQSPLLLSGDEFLGHPEILTYGFMVALPMGAKLGDITIRPTGQTKKIDNVRLYPVQEEYHATIEKSGKESFTYNEKTYKVDKSNWLKPLNIRRVSSLGTNLYRISLALVNYNANTQLLQMPTQFNIDVDFNGGNGCFREVPRANNGILQLDAVDQYNIAQLPSQFSLVLNQNILQQKWCESMTKVSLEGCDLLIITHAAFLDEANRLADHKQNRGIRTQVMTTLAIGGISTTDAQIQAWIREFYHESAIKPKYLLLIGDSEFIPTHYTDQYIESNKAFCAGDQFYGQLTNDDLEIPAMGIGRFPVDQSSEAAVIIDRIIAYENNPPAAHDRFYFDMTFAAEFQDDEDDGSATRWFAETSEDIRDYVLTQDMEVERIYKTSSTDPRWWRDGTDIPQELRMPGFAWDGDKHDVIDATNDGTLILYHRDHGSKNGWGKPNFNKYDLDDLSISNNEYPTVFSINCQSGIFDNETVNTPANGGSMLVSENARYWAEKFLIQEHGAIGIIGDTRNSSTRRNNELAMGLFDAIFPGYKDFGNNFIPSNGYNYRLGKVINHAKTYVSIVCSSDNSVKRQNTIYNLLGDPTLAVAKYVPHNLVVASLQVDPKYVNMKITWDPTVNCDNCPLFEHMIEFIPFIIIRDAKTGEIIGRDLITKPGQVSVPLGAWSGTGVEVFVSGAGAETATMQAMMN